MGTVVIVPGFYPDSTLGTVTLKTEKALQFLSIVGSASVTGTTATYRVSYYPLATTQRDVTWSVESGGTYATISSSGVLTILSGASNSEVVIKAVSDDDASIYATKTLTVTYDESGESTYDATLITSVTGTYDANQSVDFDIIANDNWMICYYRSSGEYLTAASDFFSTNGGIGLATVTTDAIKIELTSNTSSSSSSKSVVYYDNTLSYPVCFALKKDSGTYYYTIDGSTWTSFNCYYYSGSSSSTITVAAGRTDRFTDSVYGFYLYDGVDDTLVADFFTDNS